MIQQITLGRQRFRIAPLTFNQAEEFCAEEPGRESCLRIIAQSMVNAGTAMTPGQLRDTLNLRSYRALYEAVLELSALKPKGDGDPKAQEKAPDFDGLRCFLVSSVQWTHAECGDTPFPFVLKFIEHCQEFPPVHLLLRGFVGYKPPPGLHRGNGENSSEEDKRLLVGMWGGDVLPMSMLPAQLQLALARLPAEIGT